MKKILIYKIYTVCTTQGTIRTMSYLKVLTSENEYIFFIRAMISSCKQNDSI